ncbi:uncharacterized protein LOC142559434 [Dermacentor variabilis]|uniref:uncharacterized protein LOC142559434 n=1 Tax=Dermacentor variabilis TaxID=34621 RepID=UPI003F5B8252
MQDPRVFKGSGKANRRAEEQGQNLFPLVPTGGRAWGEGETKKETAAADFKEWRYVCVDIQHSINGSVVVVPLDVPTLAKNALLTVLANLLKYVSKKLSKKRKRQGTVIEATVPLKKSGATLEKLEASLQVEETIAALASRGNVKFRVLAKILLEATILCEQAGLHVDYICSDGTAWNCLMLSAFGLRDNFKDVQCKVIHFSDTSRSGSAKEATLDHMLEFLHSWEDHSKGLGFLSKHISVGLCVTLRTTKDLLRYLTEKAGFNYFMASHLSQDCLEWSFGTVRQAGGANYHFTPA